MSKIDYSKMTDAEFDQILKEIMDESPASALLTIPGIYEIVSEEFNNEILDRWAENQEENDEEDEDEE
jgi:hypothetical protein